MSQLKKVNNAAYKTTINIGAGKLKQVCWYFTNILFFKNWYFINIVLKLF